MSLPAKCAPVLLVMLLAIWAPGQVFRIQGGESTMLDAQGGSVEFKAPNYDGSFGLGFYQGHMRLGAQARYLFRGYTILAGDHNIPFILPTDVFDSSHYFSARGAGVSRCDERSRFLGFAGTTSTSLGTGFFNAASSDRPVALFLYERKLNPHFTFFSRSIFSDRQTMLEGLAWKPRKWLISSFTGGIGSNQGYLASSLDLQTEKLALRTSYVLTGDRFQRVTVLSPMSSEVTTENIQRLSTPNQQVRITTGHQNILEPVTPGGVMEKASVNQLSTDFHVEKFYFGSGLFTSNASGRKTEGTNLYVGRRFRNFLEVNTNYFRSKPQGGETTTVFSGTVREAFSSRFSLLQLISRTGGQTTFSFGGDFTSNRLMLRVDYQNIYLPFRPDRPFQQALAVNAAVRVTGPLQVTVASNIAPDGRIRYSIGASTYLYRLSGMTMGMQGSDAFSIGKYLVQGVVTDENQEPVEGAALHIGKEIAYSDSTGHFSARFSKHGPHKLAVVPDEFTTNAQYEVVSAPEEASAEADDAASQIQIVVRRVPRGGGASQR
jgi:hypothetical protein